MNMDDGWEFFVMGAIRGEMRGIWEERSRESRTRENLRKVKQRSRRREIRKR